MTDTEWLLFLANLPSTPSSLRVNVWRRMKAIGAISPHNGVWMLPFSQKNEQLMKEHQTFVNSNEGKAHILISRAIDDEEERSLVERFEQSIRQEYIEYIEKCEGFLVELDTEIEQKKFTFAELEENEGEIQKLTSWLRKIRSRDYFTNEKTQDATKSLDACRQKLRVFARSVYVQEGIEVPESEIQYLDE